MSRRRGLREGVFDRLRMRAVYRCLECGLRFKMFAPNLAFRKTRKSETLSEYIGYGNDRDRNKLQNLILIFLIVVIIAVSMTQLRRKDVFNRRIRVDAAGKQIGK